MSGNTVLTPAETKRAEFRQRLFESHGWDERRARAWALKLAARDLERDDRRLCVECRHLTSKWQCVQGGAVVSDALQRCPSFEWEVPAQ